MLDWFYPQTVEKTSSKYNGKIKVVKSRGRYSVWAGGFEQSGKLVEELWRRGLATRTGWNPVRVGRILILGLGCGTAAWLVVEKFPGAEIVGVEIDPEMIALGRKYFGLGNIPKLKICNSDGFRFINRLKYEEFDLVLIDLYCGGEIPKGIRSKNFLQKIDAILARNGIAIFNYLHFRKTEKEKREFLQGVSEYFRGIQVLEEKYNTLIFCFIPTAP